MEKKAADFWQVRKDFLAHLHYAKGYSQGTCYGYHSDLGIWGRWLEEARKDWRQASHMDTEQKEAPVFDPTEEGWLTPLFKTSYRFPCLSSRELGARANHHYEKYPAAVINSGTGCKLTHIS